MDDDRFDSWARKIAASTSRRSVVKGVAGALAGAIFGSSRVSETDAASGNLHRGQRCGDSTAPCGLCLICLDGRCQATDLDSHCSDTGCGVCQNGICRPSQDRCTGCNRCTTGLICESTCDGDDQVCCDGRCRPRGTCCGENNDCEPCQMCDNGQCVTDPHQDAKQCSSCKVCENGRCSKEDPDLYCGGICCPEGQFCAGNIFKECCEIENFCNGLISQDCCKNGNVCTQDGGCCPSYLACGVSDGAFGHGQHKECCDASETCINDACCSHDRSCGDTCCPEGLTCHNGQCCRACGDSFCCNENDDKGQVCISSDGFCCDKSANTPCGANGDGSFQQCCSKLNEECCGDKCVPKGCCDQNQGAFTAASEACCASGIACDGSCCDEGQTCCGSSCCDGPCNATNDACCDAAHECNGGCCSDDASLCCTDGCCDGKCNADGSCCHGVQVCGDFCCSGDKKCCPDSLTGVSCRDPDPQCGCDDSCGDLCCTRYEQICCRAADYTYHCIAAGTSGCS